MERKIFGAWHRHVHHAKRVRAAYDALRLADGVREALAEHIAREHRADIPRRNASLAVGVVEAAMNRLASPRPFLDLSYTSPTPFLELSCRLP